MKRLFISISIVALSCILSPRLGSETPDGTMDHAAKKYSLKYKLRKGSSFILTSIRKDHYTREIMGNEIVADQLDHTRYRFHVKSSNRKGMTLEMEYLEKDHSTEGSGSMHPDFSGCMDIKTSLFLSKSGVISDFTGFDKLPEVEIQDRQVIMDEEKYINELKDIFPKLPDHRVQAGDSWKDQRLYKELIVEDSVQIEIEVTYTFIEETVKGGLPCLVFASKFTMSMKGEVYVEGIDLAIDMEGEGEDQIYFLHEKGMLHSIEGTSFLEGSADNEDMGFSMPMRHEYTSELIIVYE